MFVCNTNTITFESDDLESSFSVCGNISRGYVSSSHMKVIGSKSRSQERKIPYSAMYNFDGQ